MILVQILCNEQFFVTVYNLDMMKEHLTGCGASFYHKLMFELALLCAVGAENLRVFLNIIAQFTV